MRGTWLEPFVWWVYISVAVTGVSGLAFLAAQQVFRQSLNDPQIQMAEDAALAIEGGAVPASVVDRSAPLIDIQKSLSPWLAVYDSSGQILESSGQLGTAPPQPPKGVFDDATWTGQKTHDTPAGKETSVSWQPNPNLRQAIVIVHATNGMYVVAGRSMRVAEDRIQVLTVNTLIAWTFTEACLLVASFLGWSLLCKQK